MQISCNKSREQGFSFRILTLILLPFQEEKLLLGTIFNLYFQGMMITPNFQKNLFKAFGIELSDRLKQEKILKLFEDFVSDIALNFILKSLDDLSVKTFLMYLEQDETGDMAFDFANKQIPDLENKLARKIKEECRQILN